MSFAGAGNPSKAAPGVHALVPQPSHTFGPGGQHALADVVERVVILHGGAHLCAYIGHRVADGLHDATLLLVVSMKETILAYAKSL